jgi:hypothetical protein
MKTHFSLFLNCLEDKKCVKKDFHISMWEVVFQNKESYIILKCGAIQKDRVGCLGRNLSHGSSLWWWGCWDLLLFLGDFLGSFWCWFWLWGSGDFKRLEAIDLCPVLLLDGLTFDLGDKIRFQGRARIICNV